MLNGLADWSTRRRLGQEIDWMKNSHALGDFGQSNGDVAAESCYSGYESFRRLCIHTAMLFYEDIECDVSKQSNGSHIKILAVLTCSSHCAASYWSVLPLLP